MHFSNPQVEQIIKDAQNEMMKNSIVVKQPVVTLNTSVYDIPSQSAESFGELEGESRQFMLSTGNNNEVIQTNVRLKAITSKLWQDQRDEDEEEDWGDGFAGYSAEEGDEEVDQESAGEELDSLVKSKSHGKIAAVPTSKLNLHAPAFVPRMSPSAAIQNAPAGILPQHVATSSKQLTIGAKSCSPNTSPSQALA